MRDALSIFDQIVSFAGSKITYENVIENLNVLDYDYYFKLVDVLLKGNYPAALLIFNEVLNKGFDGHHFITGLSKHLRDVLVCKNHETATLLQVGEKIRSRYLEQAAQCQELFILEALEINNQFDLNYKISNNNRLHVELALLQLANIALKKKVLTIN